MSEYLVDRQRLVESGVNFLERLTQKRSEVHDPFGRRERLDRIEFETTELNFETIKTKLRQPNQESI